MMKKEEDDRNSERQNEDRRIGDSEAREAGAGTLMEMKKPLGGRMNVKRVFPSIEFRTRTQKRGTGTIFEKWQRTRPQKLVRVGGNGR
jgi:hypothetical protein